MKGIIMNDINLWLHLRTLGVYRKICEGILENSLEKVVIYQSLIDSKIWVRPAVEFYDGRFKELIIKD